MASAFSSERPVNLSTTARNPHTLVHTCHDAFVGLRVGSVSQSTRERQNTSQGVAATIEAVLIVSSTRATFEEDHKVRALSHRRTTI